MDSSDQKNQTHCSSALKLLLVDDDLQVLKSLEDNLKTCGCNVTTCTSARDAVDLINEKKHEVDLVLCDLAMASTNGFEFLKHVCLKVPVFVMCMQEDTSAMMKVLREDACGCILKSSSLRKLHQHVLKRRSKKVDDPNNAADSRKKRKRLIWYRELHEKFVEEVNKIGLDKVKPRKLLKAMNVAGLTSGHIASHLQKYRLNLIQAQGESDQQKNVQKRLAVHADPAIQGPAIMMPAQNHYNAGIVAMMGVDTADQNPRVPIRYICAVPRQMLKQNNDLYAGETTQDRDGLVQNQSTDLYARPQSRVSEFESSAPRGPVRDCNDVEVQGKNGFDYLAGSFKESGDDSLALDLSAFPTWDDVDFSLLEAELDLDLDNQELIDETQAQFGSRNQFDDAHNLLV